MKRVIHKVPRAGAALFVAGLLVSAFLLRYKINVPGTITVLAGAGAPSSESGDYSPAVLRDIVYKTTGGQTLKLDLYPPAKQYFTKAPAIFLIHGGLDSGGKLKAANEWTRLILDSGLALVSMDYRLADGSAVFPAQLEDCGDAIRFMALHADEYGLDKKRFCIMGAGGGGYLALLAALTGERYASDELRGEPLGVKCAVSLCGPTDLLDFDGFTGEAREKAERLYYDYMGGSADELPERYRQASPVYQIRAGAPPVFLAHGDGGAVPFAQARRFYKSALRKSLDITLVKAEGIDFFPADAEALPPASRDVKDALKAFLIKKLVFD